jgi:pimeloyl-ACP methyl ester carboxylesterase
MVRIGVLGSIAVIGLGGFAGIRWRYRKELTRARDAARRGGRVVDTSAGPIEYAEEGAGLPLLSIHGAGGGFDQGLANAGELVGHGFRIIAPSRFGYLRTPLPRDSSPAAQADAHAAFPTRSCSAFRQGRGRLSNWLFGTRTGSPRSF